MTIQQALSKIRSAVYGREVRQAIHDGIELCYNERITGGYKPVNDINNFYSGIALFPKSSSVSNKPYDSACIVIAAGNETYCLQIAYDWNNVNAPMRRRKNNGTWSSWVLL